MAKRMAAWRANHRAGRKRPPAEVWRRKAGSQGLGQLEFARAKCDFRARTTKSTRAVVTSPKAEEPARVWPLQRCRSHNHFAGFHGGGAQRPHLQGGRLRKCGNFANTSTESYPT